MLGHHQHASETPFKRQCVIVVFPDHTHLHVAACTKAILIVSICMGYSIRLKRIEDGLLSDCIDLH